MNDGGIDAAVDRYLGRLVAERGLSPNTIDAYRRDLGQFTTLCRRLGVDRLGDVDRKTVRRFLAQITTLNYSRRSVARKASAVRAFLEDASRRGDIPANPAAGIPQPKRPGTLPKAIPEATLKRFLDDLDGTEPVDLRDRALLEVLYGTGLRVSELAAMTLDDVDGTGFVTVRGKGGGLRLARPAAEINVGAVIRDMENLELVECLGENNTCVLSPPCVLRTALQDALKAFLATLDGYTLADLIDPPQKARRQKMLKVLSL